MRGTQALAGPTLPCSLPAGSLQTAAGVIVSPSSSVNAESIETETQTVPTVPLGERSRGLALPEPLTVQIARLAVHGGKLVGAI